ncbi:MAG: hypothetical protein QM756_19300 [Polyangiaceae bacterium]
MRKPSPEMLGLISDLSVFSSVTKCGGCHGLVRLARVDAHSSPRPVRSDMNTVSSRSSVSVMSCSLKSGVFSSAMATGTPNTG